MEGVDFYMAAYNHIVFNAITYLTEYLSGEDMTTQDLVEINHHHHNPNVSTPRVQGDSNFMRWYKMISLYFIWGWVSYACPFSGWFFLILNDGGVFYNECYYMFYNGVVWYTPPEPYIIKNKKETVDLYKNISKFAEKNGLLITKFDEGEHLAVLSQGTDPQEEIYIKIQRNSLKI